MISCFWRNLNFWWVVEQVSQKVLSQSLHQLVAVSSFPSALHTSQVAKPLYFSSRDTIHLFTGISSLHLSESYSPTTPGASIKSLHKGHVKPRGVVLSQEDMIWLSRQTWQNVWEHGKILGILNFWKQTGHTVKLSRCILLSTFASAIANYKNKTKVDVTCSQGTITIPT